MIRYLRHWYQSLAAMAPAAAVLRQVQVPGNGYVSETATIQAQIPGGAYMNEGGA